MSQTTANPVPSPSLFGRVQRTHDTVQDALHAFKALLVAIDLAGPDDLPRIKQTAAHYGRVLTEERRTEPAHEHQVATLRAEVERLRAVLDDVAALGRTADTPEEQDR